MLRWKYATPLLIVGVSLTACGDSGSSSVDAGPTGPLAIDVPEGCNPLAGSACLLPWPSAIYEKDDTTAGTGRRLDIPPGVLPANTKGERGRPELWTHADGWSANMPLVMAWDSGFDPAPLVGPGDLARSLTDDSPTVVVDLDTGERVLHFAEKDSQAEQYAGASPKEIALLIRPSVRLTPGHRYAVGIKKTLRAPDGGELVVSPGFAALRDGRETGNARLEAVRPGYAEVFSALDAAGAPRADLVIAWDFRVRSDEPLHRDLLEGRDAMLAAIGETGEGFDFTVASDEAPGEGEPSLRVIAGTFQSPSLLTGSGDSDSVLHRDGDGHVAVNGTIDAPFIVVIPKCASEPANLPLPVVVFGHGLIGSSDEARGGYVRRFADQTCVAIVATDWRGMSYDDLGTIGKAFGNIDRIDTIMEKLVQGVNQFVALETLVRVKFAADPRLQVGGTAALSSTELRFYGISQGAIFGTTFMAIDPYITKGVLGVGASNFSYIIERSTNWAEYRLLAYNNYKNPLDVQILLGLLQMKWDLTDSISYGAHVTGDKQPSLPGVPAKQLLMQIAVGDSQVANIGADLWARTTGISVLEPAVYTATGVTTSPGPLSSALTQWDEHKTPLPPGGNLTEEDNYTHGTLRGRAQVIEQIREFYATGQVAQTCQLEGEPVACDCSAALEVCGP